MSDRIKESGLRMKTNELHADVIDEKPICFDFDKGFERTVGIDADTIPRVRGSKSHRALDSGLPKLSQRLKRKECQLTALRGAAWAIAFDCIEDDNAQTEEDTARLKERISKLKIRTNLFSERD